MACCSSTRCGNSYVEHLAAGEPPLLKFDHELVLDGATLPDPCNYALLHIVQPADVATDPRARPLVVVDPRAGHGPGIGGFKRDSEVGTEFERFLAFERWWGGYFRMSGGEMKSIVENLFVGNRLVRGDVVIGEHRVDLRSISAPVVVFAPWGDNITPPQALNWIIDAWGNERAIAAAGHLDPADGQPRRRTRTGDGAGKRHDDRGRASLTQRGPPGPHPRQQGQTP